MSHESPEVRRAKNAEAQRERKRKNAVIYRQRRKAEGLTSNGTPWAERKRRGLV